MGDALVEHWSRLADGADSEKTGPFAHPDDAELFRTRAHSFNLDFPPPAFIGDILNAPVVMLDANGGYHPSATPWEFSQPGAIERYLDCLRHPQPADRDQVAPYYAGRKFADLLFSGDLVLVNAVAYRSPAISQEPENRRLAELLPSTRVHRNWLQGVLRSAACGERLVVAHRNGLWGGLKRNEAPPPGVIFTSNPRPSDPDPGSMQTIRRFIESRPAPTSV